MDQLILNFKKNCSQHPSAMHADFDVLFRAGDTRINKLRSSYSRKFYVHILEKKHPEK